LDLSKVLTASYWAEFLNDHLAEVTLATGKIVAIAIGYVVIRYLLLRLIGRFGKAAVKAASHELLQARQARIATLQEVLKSALVFVTGAIGFVMILQAIGINVVPLIATASIAGLAIGFGAQKLVRDVISGFFILVEDQFGVGDYITIGAVTGQVEAVELRTTRIRSRTGELYTISNGDIAQVCNLSRGGLRLTLEIGVPAANDLDRVKELIVETGQRLREQFPEGILSDIEYKGPVSVVAATIRLGVSFECLPEYRDEITAAFYDKTVASFKAQSIALA